MRRFIGEQRFMRDRQILEMSEMEWSVLSAEPAGDGCVLFLAYVCVRFWRPATLRFLHAHWCFSEGAGPNWLYLGVCACVRVCTLDSMYECICVYVCHLDYVNFVRPQEHV